jgi:hypothetical protein
MAAADRDYIVLYRKLAEEKLMLGDGEGKLKQRDFEYLSTVIEEKSKIKLSISTLKRLWRDDFAQLPHPSTLDALVSVLDYSGWLDFKKAMNGRATPPVPSPVRLAKKRNAPASLYVIAGFVLITAGFFVLQAFNKEDKKIPVKIPFTADKTVTSGVPNTVMFNYDFRNVEADSFFIQQSWNPRNKMAVDPNSHYFSAIYYEPGFHWARLIADDSIVTFASVHIKTDGWFPVAKYDLRDHIPLYLDKEKLVGNGVMQVTTSMLKTANVDLSKDIWVRLFNIRDFGNIDSDNFEIETSLKCDLPADSLGTVACPLMELTIVTEEDVFYVPLTAKGCVSELQLQMGDNHQRGLDTNLSALGTNVYEWQNLRIVTKAKKSVIYLGQEPVHELSFTKNFGKIVGLIYTFSGPGSVDFIRIKNKANEIVYEDEFETPLP